MAKPIDFSSVTRRRAFSLAAGGAVVALAPRRVRATVMDFTVIGKDGWLFAIFDDVKHADATLMRNTTRLIGDAAAILKTAGIDTVISLTPAKARTYRDFLPPDFMFTPEGDKRYATMLDQLRASGALVPDLSTPFLDYRRTHPDDLVYLKADTHWTAAGAEVAANEIATQIKAKYRLPSSATPGTQLGSYITARQGKNDLADVLPDAIGSKYPFQTYRMREVIQTGGAASLIADDYADVLVVGNSFTQPKYGFASVLSNQLARPVALVWKVHQASPYKTLLGALGSDTFKRRRPRLLVWDFEETDMLVAPDQAGVWGANVLSSQAFLSQLRSVVSG